MPVIGFLYSLPPDAIVDRLRAFRQGLKETGYVEGQNLAIEYRSFEGQTDRLPLLVADLLRRQVAVIVANTPSALAAKAATTTVPIVFVTGGDPVRVGLVASLNRPGGNVTGISFFTAELGAKQVGLLRELRPGAARIAVLVDPNFPTTERFVSEVRAAASAMGQQIEVLDASSDREIETAMGLLDGSAKNPALQEVFFNAANLVFLKRMVALDELYIPQVASFEKQEGEIELLLKTTPVPNPQLVEAEQKINTLKADPRIDPAQLQQAEAQLAAAPQQMLTSMPVADYEDHDTEAMACWKYMNSPEGRKAKQANRKGFENVELHWQAHVAAAQAKAAANAPPPPMKPVSKSVNYKDIPDPAEADQLLVEAGIKPTPKPPGALTPAAHAMLPEPQPPVPVQ
jgi:hypothetical protein